MDEENGKHPQFKLHVDTLTLIEGLSQADYGQMAPYPSLSELIGRDVQGEAQGILQSALRCLERDYGMFFSCVRGVGVQRITETEHLQSVPVAGRRKIRRAAGRIRGRLSHLPNDKLTKEEQTKKLEEMSYAGALEDFAKEKKAKEAKRHPEPLKASKKALELFTKKG